MVTTLYNPVIWEEGKREGKQEGMEVGKQEGMQVGKQVGMQVGKQEGRQEDILVLLADYGLVSQDLNERIKSETKPETLTKWLKLAAKATSIEEFVAKMDLN